MKNNLFLVAVFVVLAMAQVSCRKNLPKINAIEARASIRVLEVVGEEASARVLSSLYGEQFASGELLILSKRIPAELQSLHSVRILDSGKDYEVILRQLPSGRWNVVMAEPIALPAN